MQHDLHLRVGPDLRQRLVVEARQRVEQLDVLPAVDLHDDLHQAQQRAVAALGHELRVDPEPAGGARGVGDLGRRHRPDRSVPGLRRGFIGDASSELDDRSYSLAGAQISHDRHRRRALAAAPASAASAAKNGAARFVGVVADGPLLHDPNVDFTNQLDTMVVNGVQTLRTSFNWAGAALPSFADVPPDQRDRFRDENGVPTDYTQLDRLVSERGATAHRVLPEVLITAPGWAARSRRRFAAERPPAATPAFAGALARRYGPGGTFWTAHPTAHRPSADPRLADLERAELQAVLVETSPWRTTT